jgi:hypothetical protein
LPRGEYYLKAFRSKVGVKKKFGAERSVSVQNRDIRKRAKFAALTLKEQEIEDKKMKRP